MCIIQVYSYYNHIVTSIYNTVTTIIDQRLSDDKFQRTFPLNIVSKSVTEFVNGIFSELIIAIILLRDVNEKKKCKQCNSLTFTIFHLSYCHPNIDYVLQYIQFCGFLLLLFS